MNEHLPNTWLQDLFAYLEHYQPQPDPFRHLVTGKLERREFETTTRVVNADDVVDEAYWIQEGYGRGYYEVSTGDGPRREVTVAFWRPRVILTVSDSFFNRTPALHHVEFAAGSAVLGISHRRFRELATETGAANELAVKLTAAHYTETLDRSELLKLSPEERYRQFLDFYGAAIEQCFYLRDIASFLGIAQETLSRLRGWK